MSSRHVSVCIIRTAYVSVRLLQVSLWIVKHNLTTQSNVAKTTYYEIMLLYCILIPFLLDCCENFFIPTIVAPSKIFRWA